MNFEYEQINDEISEDINFSVSMIDININNNC